MQQGLSLSFSTNLIYTIKMKLFYFDLETTATPPQIVGIHQISGVIEIDGAVVETFNFKVRPRQDAFFSQEALDVCGVTKEQILAYEPIGLVYSKLTALLGKYVNKFDKKDKFFAVGYNIASFDMGILREFFVLNSDLYFGSWFWSAPLDCMVLAQVFLANVRPDMENFKQGTVAKKLGIAVDDSQLHDALYDIYICRGIFKKLTGGVV